MKKKELDYFTIDGGVGGNQDWFQNVVMYMGGCAAATAQPAPINNIRIRNLFIIFPIIVPYSVNSNTCSPASR